MRKLNRNTCQYNATIELLALQIANTMHNVINKMNERRNVENEDTPLSIILSKL